MTKDPREGICAILMLKNENRYILNDDGTKPQYTMLEQNLRRLSQIVEEVYIVDGCSTDGSQIVYEKYYDTLIKYVKFHDKDEKFNEMYRKQLLDKAKERGMKWLMVVDGDEIYEDKATEYIHKFCAENNHLEPHTVKFHYVNFWRSRLKYRTDKWSTSWFQRLFSINDQLSMIGSQQHDYAFVYMRNEGSREHHRGKITEAPVKCLHYGWADWQHRTLKTQRYINYHAEVYHTSVDEAKNAFVADLDERGITFASAEKHWGSEFRTGKFDY